MRVLNDKIDFSQFGLGAIRQNEIWMPLMKFKEGYYTDAGYRFRENKFEQKDHWVPGKDVNEKKFYDVTFFSSDEIEVGKDFNLVAEMYFRIKTDLIVHSR